MSDKLQKKLNDIFDSTHSKAYANSRLKNVVNRLKEKGYNNLIEFTNEIMAIHNKLSELSTAERKVMNYIYIELYKYNESIKTELDNAPEGSEGIVIKVK